MPLKRDIYVVINQQKTYGGNRRLFSRLAQIKNSIESFNCCRRMLSFCM